MATEVVSSLPLSLSSTATILAVLVALYISVLKASSRKIHPQEPDVISPAIPIVGHLLGMALYGGKYVKQLGHAIFALPVPASRLYIITDPALAAAAQRASKTLSFSPIVVQATPRVLGLDERTAEIARKNVDPGPGDEPGVIADIQDMVYKWLGPGDYLKELSLDACNELSHTIADSRDALNHQTDARITTDLLNWLRHIVTMSTAMYLYGPKNPLALDPELETAFWDFDHGLAGLLVSILPQITARRAYAGREKLVAALTDYLKADNHKIASKIIQKRVEILTHHDWTLENVARSELSFLFAGIVNTTTTTFWIVLQLFADPTLLASVRAELEAFMMEKRQDGARDDWVVNVEALKKRCPLLVAVWRECLRLGSETSSTRMVKEDTMLSDRYFLKKGTVVQISGATMHANGSIWGEDVNFFNPGRWVDGWDPVLAANLAARQDFSFLSGITERRSQIHPAAFRGFGGGKTLCPGRHFAMNEILSLVCSIILQFNIDAPDRGNIKVPKKDDAVLPIHVLEPIEPVKVVISPRPEWQGVLQYVMDD